MKICVASSPILGMTTRKSVLTSKSKFLSVQVRVSPRKSESAASNPSMTFLPVFQADYAGTQADAVTGQACLDWQTAADELITTEFTVGLSASLVFHSVACVGRCLHVVGGWFDGH